MDKDLLANATPEELKKLSKDIYGELLELVIAGVALEFHRAVKLNYLEWTDEKQSNIDTEEGVDIFGPIPNIKKLECKCPMPHCKRTVSAVRFASHLANCMGCGRTCSQVANQRIRSFCQGQINTDDDSDAEKKSDGKQKKNKKKKSTKGKRKDGKGAAAGKEK